jgi:hypothetical protein
MTMPDYYLTDTILVEYHGGGEIVNHMRIYRSKHPRWSPPEVPDHMLKDWIEDNEELQTRIVFEDGHWNVSSWEEEFYIAELAELNIIIDCVLKISRVVSYTIR